MPRETNTLPRLRALGDLQLEPFGFAQAKPLLLLAYVALEGEQNRDHLRELFFPNASDAAGSLRSTINRVRQILPTAFEGSGSRLKAGVACDAAEVLFALEHQDLERAVRLYSAPFLENLEISDVHPELLEWVESMRTYLARRVIEAHLMLAERAVEQLVAHYHLEAARNISGFENLESAWLQRIMLLETREYTTNETTKLLAIPNNLSQSLTSFIGRARESAHVLELLQEEARLVTLVGPGGVGKTRFALETARQSLQLEVFTDGVLMVMLEAINDLEALLSRIVQVLKISLKPDAPVLEQIIEGIGQGQILLVLDNFEHLIEHGFHLTLLLERCPNLRLIVTSRERLNLHSEWITPLEGLSARSDQDAALELFLDRAARVGMPVQTPEDRIDALEICKLVHGFPLAIELAVPLLRALSLSELREDLSRNLDLLDNTLRDTPERHRSIRAVFEHSWKMLSTPEQQSLAQLAVFRGGATREAIGAINATKLQTLASLTDKSLVQRNETSRFGIHPLLYQFTLEKLLELPDHASSFERHQDYYLTKLERDTAQIRGSEASNAVRNIETELENIRAAWSHAIQHNQAARLEKVQDIVVFFDQRSRYAEGLVWFEEAIATLEVESPESLALAGMLIGAAWLQFRLGQNNNAQKRAEYAQKLASTIGEAGELVLSKALNILGIIFATMAEYKKAINYYEKALFLIRKHNDKSRETTCLSNLATLESTIGNTKNVINYYQTIISSSEKQKDYSTIILSRLNYSSLLISNTRNPNFLEILNTLKSALDLINHTELQKMTIPYYLLNMSLCLFYLNDYQKSEYFAQLILKNIDFHYISEIQSGAYLILSRIEIQSKNLQVAENYIIQCLKYIRSTQENSQKIDGLITFAVLKGLLGNEDESKKILNILLRQKNLQIIQKREIQSAIRLLNLSFEKGYQENLMTQPTVQDLVSDILLVKNT